MIKDNGNQNQCKLKFACLKLIFVIETWDYVPKVVAFVKTDLCLKILQEVEKEF
jgi:hypothetical protein